MKPQLVSLESGYHNADLAASTTRIVEGGSWKKQRVIMLIPASAQIPTKVYLSHCGLIFPPNQAAHRMAAIGMEVGEAFSSSIESIIASPGINEWEFLLTIEHDNIPPSDGLVRLIKRMEEHPELSCIGGLYWTKGPGGVPQIWGDPADPVLNFRPQAPDPNGGLVECCGTGMGFNLWRLAMFKDERLRKPWFKTVADHTGVGTQDLYFWGDARKYGYRCAIDCSVKVGHYDLEGKFGQPDTTW
tara:strand:- start:6 stop:737 length:732 start_codon:yes stop_codon:yes gene_type:complete